MEIRCTKARKLPIYYTLWEATDPSPFESTYTFLKNKITTEIATVN